MLMPRPVLGNVLNRMRTRPDQAHVSFEDVPQLRQLIQAVFAQKPAEPCDAGIIGNLEEGAAALIQMPQLSAKSVRARNHGTEFVTGEEDASFPHTQRSENDWASGRLQAHGNGDHEHQRPEKNKGDRSKQRSEEHTSELQSRVDLVCRLLLEKK